MEENLDINNKSEEKVDNDKKRLFVILFSVSILLSIVGVVLGIYGIVKINNLTTRFDDYVGSIYGIENNSEEGNAIDEYYDDSVEEYGLPNNVESIGYINIAYNNYEDFITIADGSVLYEAYDKHSNSISEDIPMSTKKIFQYFFDNDLQYLGDNDEQPDDDWSVKVYTTDNKYSYVSGVGEEPEWLKKLLNDVNVDTYGYKSRKK